jgi:transposase-like protein
MNLLQITKKFPTQKACIEHLEQLRWKGTPVCTFCESEKVSKLKNESRYHCNKCNRSFSVLVGTIFEETRMPLQNWFYSIGLMLNAKKGISAKQLQRDLGLSYKTAWYTLMRIRCALSDNVQFLRGVVQMDEVYVGGKPRKGNIRSKGNVITTLDKKNKRGRGTDKVKIVGIAERGKHGKVVAEVMERLTTKNLMALLKKHVSKNDSIVVTDGFKAYKQLEESFNHVTINHSKQFSKDGMDLNQIENFWSILKRGISGQYHYISKQYLPFYLAEFTYRYNNRQNKEVFEDTIKVSVKKPKCVENYKGGNRKVKNC